MSSWACSGTTESTDGQQAGGTTAATNPDDSDVCSPLEEFRSLSLSNLEMLDLGEVEERLGREFERIIEPGWSVPSEAGFEELLEFYGENPGWDDGEARVDQLLELYEKYRETPEGRRVADQVRAADQRLGEVVSDLREGLPEELFEALEFSRDFARAANSLFVSDLQPPPEPVRLGPETPDQSALIDYAHKECGLDLFG